MTPEEKARWRERCESAQKAVEMAEEESFPHSLPRSVPVCFCPPFRAVYVWSRQGWFECQRCKRARSSVDVARLNYGEVCRQALVAGAFEDGEKEE